MRQKLTTDAEIDRTAKQAFAVQKSVIKSITTKLMWKDVGDDLSAEAVLIGTAAALLMQAQRLYKAWHTWCVQEGIHDPMPLKKHRAEFIDFAADAWDDGTAPKKAR